MKQYFKEDISKYIYFTTENGILLNGDCLEIMKKLKNNIGNIIISDPPYLINYKTNRRKNKEHDFCKVIQNDNNPTLIKNYIKECYRILKDNTAMYIFCSFDKVDFFKKELEKYFNIKNMIIWKKNSWTAGDLEAQFGKQYEIIFLVNKGRKLFNGKRITDVWEFDRVAGNNLLHQNQKPLRLINQCFKKHSNENDIVFEGFNGSGSISVSAENLNRKWICCELEKEYCEITKQRILKLPKYQFAGSLF